MKKKWLLLLSALMACLCAAVAIVGCDGGHVHNYGEWETMAEPTCIAEGSKERACVCGDTQTDVVPATGEHAYGEWTVLQEATCVTQGIKERVCACGEVETQSIFVTGHIYGDDNVCDDCGYVFIRYIRVDADENEDESGEYILFGSYPQTEVMDSTLTSALNTLAGTLPTDENDYAWTSYGYYIYGSNSTDYMWYQDVTYGGEDYRAVYFTSYRPYYTSSSSSTSYTNQDDNGYYMSTVYWFKYEPIKWKIIDDSESGYATLLCEMLIDSQAYQNTYYYDSSTGYYYATDDAGNILMDGEDKVYANNYEYSTIRAWLNDTFYQTAFNELEQAIIQTVTVDNSAATTSSSSNSYACNNTQDKVWLLSYQEAKAITGSTGSTTEREKQTTDYAQCQGAWTSTSTNYAGNGYWWLRSPYSNNSSFAYIVFLDGYLDSSYYVDDTRRGVCPALKIQL